MGLLDSLLGSSIDDPKTLGLLQLASSLSSGQKFMPALADGLLGRSQILSSAERQKAAQQMQQMQLQQAQRQMAQQQAQDQFRASIPSPQMQAAQAAMAGGGGPTMANAQNMRPVDPMAQMRHGAMQVGLGDPMEYLASLQPKPRKLTTVAPGASVIDENDPSRALFTAPKEANKPSALQEYEYAKGQGYGGSYLDFQLAQRRAGASSVSVNTGPKAFANELGKYAVETFGKEREGAQAASGTLQSVAEIRKAAQGGAYQGAGADLKLGAAKALGALGMPYDAKTVANSELFAAQANQFVLNSIKGLGQNPSNADREFIERTVPRLQTDPASLPKLLQFIENKARTQLTNYNKKAKSVQAGADYLPFSLEVQEPDTSGGGWSIRPAGAN